MPIGSGAGKTASSRQFDVTYSLAVGKARLPAGKGIAKVSGVEVALVPNAGREAAAQNSLALIFEQFFADGLSLPTRFERVRQRGVGQPHEQDQ